MGSSSSVKRKIVIKPSKRIPYIGQNFELKCQVKLAKTEIQPTPRFFGNEGGYTKWSKVDGYMSPNVRNVRGNTIR